MTIKYTIDRKSLYNGKYSNAKIEVISGCTDDRITLKSHLSVIYTLARILRRRQHESS